MVAWTAPLPTGTRPTTVNGTARPATAGEPGDDVNKLTAVAAELRGAVLTAVPAAAVGTNELAPALASTIAAAVQVWRPNTAYPAGAPAINPSGVFATAKVAFTSGTTYAATNWNELPQVAVVPAATTTALGTVQLAGDLAGTPACC